MLNIGIRSSSTVNSEGFFDLKQLAIVKNTGFDIVELNFNHPQTGLDFNDAKQGKLFRKEAETLSICLLAHAPEICIDWLDKAKMKDGVERYRDVLNGIARFNIKSMVIHADRYLPENPDNEQEQIESLIDALKSLTVICEELQIHIFLETMPPGHTSCSSIDNLVRVIDIVKSPWVRICVDTNHLNLNENLYMAIVKSGKYISEFHLSDNHGQDEEHLLPYDGLIDWGSFAKAICDIDYKGHFILEPGRVPCSNAYEVARRLEKEICNIRP